MATSSVTISITKTSELGGGSENAVSGPLLNTNAPEVRQQVGFAAGTFTAVSIPNGTTGVYILPPAGNSSTITLKGVTGDTGVLLHPTQPTFLSLANTSAFGLLCSGATVMEFLWT